MAFPENVRFYREQKKLSQKELAELVGVSQQTIDKYEDGSRLPNIYNAVQLAKALHTTCEKLTKIERNDQKLTVHKPYYPKLEAKIAEMGITKKSIAEKLGITQKTLSCKLSGKWDFYLKEAVKIHTDLFPDTSLLELFRHE